MPLVSQSSVGAGYDDTMTGLYFPGGVCIGLADGSQHALNLASYRACMKGGEGREGVGGRHFGSSVLVVYGKEVANGAGQNPGGGGGGLRDTI